MKTTAIIAEYNPFHNGHMQQIKAIKKEHKNCIVLMSGNFVQRGAPAIVDKFTRTLWALKGGADLVLELPLFSAAAGAEQFAFGACSLLTDLGIIDELCFGCEYSDLSLLESIADILSEPPASFHSTIQTLLRQGNSYASARETALYPLIADQITPPSDSSLSKRVFFHAIFSSPNTILGIEYCKALKKLGSPIRPFPIPRTGDYHSHALPETETAFISASAVRNHLFSQSDPALLSVFLPEYVLSDLSVKPWLKEQDFSSCLYYALLGKTAEELSQYHEVSPDLAQKIYNRLPQYRDFSSFAALLKTKELSHARIRRALFHILLSIKPEDMKNTPYLRLLGLKKEKSRLLRAIPKQTGPVIITKPANAKKQLAEKDYFLFEKEVTASQLYGFIAFQKQPSSKPYQELAISPVIL